MHSGRSRRWFGSLLLLLAVSITASTARANLHVMPADVQAADNELAARRRLLIRAYAQAFGKGQTPYQLAKWGEGALRQLAAGSMIFQDDPMWLGDDADRLLLAQTLLGQPGGTLEDLKGTWTSRLNDYIPEIKQNKDTGTSDPSKWCDPSDTGHTDCGNYDFVLVGAVSTAYLFKDRPDIMSNEFVRQLITHGMVQFDASDTWVSGDLPFSGNVAGDGLSVGPSGHPSYIRSEGTVDLVRYVVDVSTPETENHALNLYTWRYLAQNYLQWVATQDSGARQDPALTSLYTLNEAYYANSPDVTDLLLRMLNRFLHFGAFETNAKSYEAVSMQALLALASYADALPFAEGSPEADANRRVATAARAALDYLASEFAFQSFEGKRVSPMRRRNDSDKRNNVHPYHNNYIPNMLGVLTGDYVFDEALGYGELAQPRDVRDVRSCDVSCTGYETPPDDESGGLGCDGAVCDCSGLMDQSTSTCNGSDGCSSYVDPNGSDVYQLPYVSPAFGPLGTAACYCTCDPSFHTACSDCGDAPYLDVADEDQEAGYALWAALSSYTVPPPIHDLMLNKHSGYWARIQSKYWYSQYPIHTSAILSETGEPGRPATATPSYDLAPGSGTFSPVMQYYYATPTSVSAAGGRSLPFLPEQCSGLGADDFGILSVSCLFTPPVCAVALSALYAELPFCKDVDKLHDDDVLSRPYTVMGKGQLGKVHGNAYTDLATETLVMPGQSDTAASNNLDSYKGFSYGYSHKDNNDESQHTSFPMLWPDSWSSFQLPEAVLDRGVFEFFDFTHAPADNPLTGQYLILSRVSKSENKDIYRTYARGFWEIVPGTRYASGTDFRNAVLSLNPASHYPDATDQNFAYTMTTGETLILDPLVGSSYSDHGIIELRAPDGSTIPPSAYQFDSSATQPLIDVWQMDANSNFTGRKLANAPGDGTMRVDNCYLGQAWVIDAADYQNPQRGQEAIASCGDQPPANAAPIAWYVASPDDVTVDSGGVTRWKDRSGNGNDVTQTFYYGEPQFNPAGWNGNKPTVTFDGGDLMRLDTWSGAPSGTNASFTVLAVMRPAAPQDSAVAGWWSPVGAGVTWAGLKGSNGQTLPELTRMDAIGGGQLYTGSVDLGSGRHVVAWRFSADEQLLKLTVDGVTTVSPLAPAIANLANMPFVMGAKSLLPTGLFTGDISELKIIPASLSDAQVADFTAQAQTTWGGLSTLSGANPCVDANGSPATGNIHCDDGDPGTVGDHCANGACTGATPTAGSPGLLRPIVWYYAAPADVETSGSGVSTWFDRSPNHRDLTQLFDPGRPTLGPSSWNPNASTMQFNGGKLLRYEGWTGTPTGDDGAFTVLAVLTTSSTQQVGVASWWNANNYGKVWCELTPASGSLRAELLRQDDYSNQDLPGPAVTSGPHVVVWRYTPATESLTVSVDGNASTISGLTSLGPIAPDAFLVGATSYLPTGMFSGELAELALVPASLSDDQVTAFAGYARRQWGLP